MVSRCVFIISLLVFGCGVKEADKDNSVIAVEGEVMDAVIDSRAPDQFDFNSETVNVGSDETNSYERRLLLFLPKLSDLYEPDIVLSSIADIRLEIVADGVPINPRNIQLHFVGVTWTPYVSWNSRFALSDDYNWATPGGDTLDLGYVTPDIEKLENSLKKLSFNVTQEVIASILDGQVIYGFILRVHQNATNSRPFIIIRTTNGPNSTDPRAILSYSKEDILQP
jgi:hypothetical protein